jgi:hypothetical protein
MFTIPRIKDSTIAQQLPEQSRIPMNAQRISDWFKIRTTEGCWYFNLKTNSPFDAGRQMAAIQQSLPESDFLPASIHGG